MGRMMEPGELGEFLRMVEQPPERVTDSLLDGLRDLGMPRFDGRHCSKAGCPAHLSGPRGLEVGERLQARGVCPRAVELPRGMDVVGCDSHETYARLKPAPWNC